MTLLDRLAAEVLLLDGAMGTGLQARGLALGAAPDLWVLERPELVERVHRDYIEAGAQVVFTNTFGANRPRLEAHGAAAKLFEINTRAVGLARGAAGGRAYVAGNIGPTGIDLTRGEVGFDELVEVFREQAEALVSAGVDALAVETMFDLEELRAAIVAANGCRGHVPVMASMTFEGTGRTSRGVSARELASAADGLGVAIVGANCSEGPQSLLPIVETLARVSSAYVSAKPSAGLPAIRHGQVTYPVPPADLAAQATRLVGAGARLIGGCCGTTPEWTGRIRRALRDGRGEGTEARGGRRGT